MTEYSIYVQGKTDKPVVLVEDKPELLEALQTISNMHDGNQPAALNMPDLDYARCIIRNIHAVARKAIARCTGKDAL